MVRGSFNSLRFKAFSIHLLTSLAILIAFSALIFMVWYPEPFDTMMQVWSVFWVLMLVDLILGPTLTALIANPRKLAPQFIRDITIIVLVQITALAGGIWSIYLGRPLYLAFDTGIFYVVTQTDLLVNNNSEITTPGIFQGPTLVYVMLPDDPKKQVELVTDWLIGSNTRPAYKPELYSPLSDNEMSVFALGKTLNQIMSSQNSDNPNTQKLALRYNDKNPLFYSMINNGNIGTLVINKHDLLAIEFLPDVRI